MDTTLEQVCLALDQLGQHVINQHPHQTDGPLTEHFGALAPALGRREIASIATRLAAEIRQTSSTVLDSAQTTLLKQVLSQISVLQQSTVPHIYNGNVGAAFPTYCATLQHIRSVLLPSLGWIDLPSSDALPAKLARRVSAAKTRLDSIEEAIPGLSQKVSEINAAHAVAENLEVDLQALVEAREKVSKAEKETGFQTEQVRQNMAESSRYIDTMLGHVESTEKLVSKCEEAYQITTTHGLAAAFDQRAKSLSASMWIWVAGLMAALITGAFVGSGRLVELTDQLNTDTPKWGLITAHAVLSLLGVGAPLWFAWLSTKQISQRFRLAEDYAFKASVAKAYEGYRKQAVELDPEFQAKLFDSALSRLDEAPLRLVEQEHHGSPWAEFANSEAVRSAIRLAPELQSRMIDTIREMTKSSRAASSAAAKVIAEASKPDDANNKKPESTQ